MEVIGTTANDTWIGLLETIKTCGNVVQPRGFKCYEVMNLRTCFPMHKPIVTVRDRNLGYRFLFAEALWILEGKEDVATIAPFSKHIVQFSDDGETFFGAYGPRIVDQINWVVRKLAEASGPNHLARKSIRFQRHSLYNLRTVLNSRRITSLH